MSFWDKLITVFKSETVRRLIAVFGLKILGILSSYIFALLVSRYYGVEGWGVFSICLGVATFGVLIGKVGFDMALLRFASTFNKNYEELSILKTIYHSAFKWLLPLGGIITLGLCIVSPFFAHLFLKDSSQSVFFVLIAFSIVPTVFTLIDSEGLRGLGKTDKYMFVQNILLYLLASIGVFLVVNYWGEEYGITIVFIIYVVSSIIVFGVCRYWWQKVVLSVYPLSSSEQVPSIKEIFAISYPMFWSNAMFVLINWTDTLMLGMFSTEADVGVYNASVKISNLVSLPLLVVTSIAAPMFASKNAIGDKEGLNNVVKQSTTVIFILTLPLFVAIMIFPQFFLGIFGRGFVEGKYVLMILILGQFFKSICGSTDFLLQMTGHEKIFQRIILGAMLINISINIVLIPLYGSLGATISNVVTIVFWNILAVYFINKKLNINAIFNPLHVRELRTMIASNKKSEITQ